jgi:hypothetical protein
MRAENVSPFTPPGIICRLNIIKNAAVRMPVIDNDEIRLAFAINSVA